jgi:TRAP-type C4-dicarboxylate transport system permease small subunit
MLDRPGGGPAIAGLVASALALALAPLLLPTSYSWVAHTTSESAAQGVPGSWLARVGFLVFGAAVLATAFLA